MHFITGGAYNGKNRWVNKHYNLGTTKHLWLSAYKDETFITAEDRDLPSIVVLEGIEQWIRSHINRQKSMDSIVAELQNYFHEWLHWEKQSDNHQVIIIGTDITKGIVPVEQHDRRFRDVTGWVYQFIAKQSVSMDIIWYGIAERIK